MNGWGRLGRRTKAEGGGEKEEEEEKEKNGCG